METRFLINGSAADAWQGFTFRWRLDGSDADLITEDAPSTLRWPLDNGTVHVHSYPSRTECARCHDVGPRPAHQHAYARHAAARDARDRSARHRHRDALERGRDQLPVTSYSAMPYCTTNGWCCGSSANAAVDSRKSYQKCIATLVSSR
jgi:hypothetical protein